MALTLYRRHVRACAFFGKSRRARNNSQCKSRCPIWVQGTLAGDKVWKSLDLADWGAAADLVRSWEAAGEIGVAKSEAPDLAEAVSRFLDDCRAQRLSHETTRKYQTLLSRRMIPWAAKHGRTKLRSWDPSTIRKFRESWDDGAIYATKNLERLRAFFRFSVSEKWLKENPAKEISAPVSKDPPRVPLSEAEMKKILAATESYRGNQERIKAFILVMRYTGMRISDAICLRRDAVRNGKIFIRTEKTGADVFVPVPPLVVEALKECPPGERFFWNGKGKLQTRVSNWSRYLASVFRLAGVEASSHRFRHTFSRSLLENGVPVEDVAMLLGNSPRIVAKHYASWVKERQVRLEERVKATW